MRIIICMWCGRIKEFGERDKCEWCKGKYTEIKLRDGTVMLGRGECWKLRTTQWDNSKEKRVGRISYEMESELHWMEWHDRKRPCFINWYLTSVQGQQGLELGQGRPNEVQWSAFLVTDSYSFSRPSTECHFLLSNILWFFRNFT